MFTGLIDDVGVVERIERTEAGRELRVSSRYAGRHHDQHIAIRERLDRGADEVSRLDVLGSLGDMHDYSVIEVCPPLRQRTRWWVHGEATHEVDVGRTTRALEVEKG